MKSERLESPTAWVHRGSVLAAGFWIADDARDAERRLLDAWQPGCVVRRVPGGYVLLLRRELRVTAELGALAALVQIGRRLTSAPLRPRELEALGQHDLALVSAGRVVAFERERLELIAPESWLNVSDFQVKTGASLGEPPALAPALSRPADATKLFDESVGRSADDRARQAGVLEQLVKAAQGGGARPSALRARVAALALGLARQLASWLFRPAAAPRASGASSKNALAKVPPLAGPSAWERLKSRLFTWLSRTRLASYLGRKHAEYLRDLLDLLDRRDDEEVLRKAIPLGKSTGEAGSPALLPPSPRTSFDISLGWPTTGPSIGIVSDLFEMLRRSYEAVFARLDAAGKHEQAAYFLAEILGEAERAVAYLERHGQRALAAQLAEARQLAPGLVVRQWFLAGDRRRAVLIAVREGAFNDAIIRLESSGHKDEAEALRLLQAERLAQAGLLVRAAELVHREPRSQPLALRWLSLAREGGDLRGVALELYLDDSHFDRVHEAVASLVEAGPTQLPTWLHVANELARLNVEAGKPLARELVRELLAHASATGMGSVGAAAARVASYIGGAFKADQPSLLTFERRFGGSLRRYEYEASDSGTAAVHDVHRFGALLLVALGEGGSLLLNRHGKRVAHFELPAEALVTSLDGSRALCVAKRGDRLEVGRIDLAARRCARWCELEAASFARQFDGETWLVCTTGWTNAPHKESELLQLDAIDDEPRILRRVPHSLEGPSIDIDGRHVNLVGAETFGSIERLRYELPQLTLRQRATVVDLGKTEADRIFVGDATASGDRAPVVYTRWSDSPTATISFAERTIDLSGKQLEGAARLAVSGQFYALTLTGETETRILIGAGTAAEPYVDLTLHGAKRSALRFYDDLVLIADSAGRIVGIDPVTGGIVYDQRS